MIINYLSENLLLPLGDKIAKTSVHKHLHFLFKSQYWTREQIDNYQKIKLQDLITFSVSSVPYYHNVFRELKLNPQDIKSIKDLNQIPILTKSILFDKGIDAFTSNKFPAKYRLSRSSSGSTGEPLFYYTTKEAYSINLAAILRGWYWMGYKLGDKYIKLSQNPRKFFLKRIQDRFSRNSYLATNPLIDSNFDFILNRIEHYKPKIIRCYPDPLLFLAHYKKNHPEVFKYKPMAITTTGNTLFKETRSEIEEAFGCKIFDSYNCEGNSAVFECPTHSCYHSAEEYGITEVLDDKGLPITSGIGRLVSTDLWNLAHPFIRYDTQDLVEINKEPCSCGRNLLKIQRIVGRDNEILIAPNGRKFIVHNFTGFFQTDHPKINRSIEQFQVIKHNDQVNIKIIVNSRYNSSVADFIRIYWENEIKMKVEVEVVDNIPLTKSGKRRFILNS